MACGAALGVVIHRRLAGLRRWRELSGCGVIVEHGISPSVRVRESLAVLHDELDLRQVAGTVSGWVAEKGGSVIFFGFHSIFTILEPSGKGLPLPGMPS